MPTDLFTHLLIEKLQSLTDLSKSREQAEEDYQEFDTLISDSIPDRTEELNKMESDLAIIRDQIESYFRSLEEQPRYYSEEFNLRDVTARLNAIETQLNESINLQRYMAQLDLIQRKLNETRQSSIESYSIEDTLINEYFIMDEWDFKQLTPEIHIWFLERISTSDAYSIRQSLSRLVEVYFDNPVGILRYLVIRNLCLLDNNHFHLLNILEKIFKNYSTAYEQDTLISQVVNILIDIGTANSLKSLRELVTAEEKYRSTISESIVKNVVQRRLDEPGIDKQSWTGILLEYGLL